MHTVISLLKSNTAIGVTQRDKQYLLYFSRIWLNDVVFSKEIVVGLKLTEKMHFRVTRPMFNRVVREQRNDLVGT